MGRRRAGGAEPLPQAVRRNNAKNDRKTMEAMAASLWTSVESGRERRLRLAAERLYGLTEPRAAAPDTAADKATTQQTAADASTTTETAVKVPDVQEAAIPSEQSAEGAVPAEEADLAEAAVPVEEAEVPGQSGEAFMSSWEVVEAPKQSEDVFEIQEFTTKTDEVTIARKQPEETQIFGEADESDKTAAISPLPSEKGVECPAPNDEFVKAQAPNEEAVKAPTPFEKVHEALIFSDDVLKSTEPFEDVDETPIPCEETGKTIVSSEEPAEALEPNHHVVEAQISAEEAAKASVHSVGVTKPQVPSTETAEAPVPNEETAQDPTPTEKKADAPVPSKDAAGALVRDQQASEISLPSEQVETAPTAETAETGFSGKEADLPTASRSEVITETPSSTATPTSSEVKADTATEKQGSQSSELKHDSKKKKKKKGKHVAEQPAPPVTAEIGPDTGSAADYEHGQKARAGKKQKRNRDKQKESESEFGKPAVAAEKSEDSIPPASEVVPGIVSCSGTSPGMTINEGTCTAAAPLEEAWTTVETKKGKRKRKRSERKSESESKSQADVTEDGETQQYVKTEPSLSTEQPSIPTNLTEAIKDDSASQGKSVDEQQKSTGTTLDDFDHLVSSIGSLKEKFKEAAETRAKAADELPTFDKTTNEMTEAEQKAVQPSPMESSVYDASDLLSSEDGVKDGFKGSFDAEEKAAQEAPTTEEQNAQGPTDTKPNVGLTMPVEVSSVAKVQNASKPEEMPVRKGDAFSLWSSAGDDLEAGFKDAFGSEEQCEKEPEEVDSKRWAHESADSTGVHMTMPVAYSSANGSQGDLKYDEKSPKEADVTPDAFDLLMSASDDLESGFKDAFESEERYAKESEVAKTDKDAFDLHVSNDDSLNEVVKYSFEADNQQAGGIRDTKEDADMTTAPADKSKESSQYEFQHEPLSEEDATPDVFDLLMSADGDLEEGFKDSFGLEEHVQEAPEALDTKGRTRESTDSKPGVDVTMSAESSLAVGSQDASKPGDKSAKRTGSTPDVFDLLMSADDDLEEGFKDAFETEKQPARGLKVANIDTDAFHQFTSNDDGLDKGSKDSLQHTEQQEGETTDTKEDGDLTTSPADKSKGQCEDISQVQHQPSEEGGTAPDAFNLLMSADDDLEKGFKDSFGSEEQVEKESEEVDAKGRAQESTDSKLVVDVTMSDECRSTMGSQAAEKPEEKSAKKTDSTPDAFDLLMSAGDDLEEGFKDAFGLEEQPENEPKTTKTEKKVFDQLTSNDDGLNEGFEYSFESGEQEAGETRGTKFNVDLTTPPAENVKEQCQDISKTEPKPAEEVNATPDAFDLLMSAGDDLEEGFKDSFGSEEQEQEQEPANTKRIVQESAETKAIVGSAEGSSTINVQATSKSEEKSIGATPDAFDLLMSAGSDLEDGFKDAFGSEEQSKPIKAKTDEHHDTKSSKDSDGKELPQVHADKDATKCETIQTREDLRPRESVASGSELPSMPVTVLTWFDKTLYDNAEAQYHETLSRNRSGNKQPKDGIPVSVTFAVDNPTTESRQSEIVEPPENVISVSEVPSKPAIVSDESAWFDKVSHDDAETHYYERLSQSKTSEDRPEGNVPSSPTTSVSSLTLITTISGPAPESKQSETAKQPEGVISISESPSKPAVATDEGTWFDKVLHDNAEARHYERLSQIKSVESGFKSNASSSPTNMADDPTTLMTSSEQTWFDKPFHDSAETVHHVRQSSSESPNSGRSFPLYEGSCDHFSPDDQQAPEDKVLTCGEEISYDSWTESKLYKVTDAPNSKQLPSETVYQPVKTAPAEGKLSDAVSQPQKETDDAGAAPRHPDDAAAQQTVSPTHITIDTNEPVRSPTSEGSRSRRSTFNSAVSPLSPQVELDDVYFEDVVLAGRQSDVTMAALRGFTASPLSEGLAPGEQLDSLRTEPDLELSEPGTADTLDDGEDGAQPFSYDDVGEEDAVTPVADVASPEVVQPHAPEVKLATEQPVVELKKEMLSSTSEEAVSEVKLAVEQLVPGAKLANEQPMTELKSDAPSSSQEAVWEAKEVAEQPLTELKSEILFSMSKKAVPEVKLEVEQPAIELQSDVLFSTSKKAEPEVKQAVEQLVPDVTLAAEQSVTELKSDTPSLSQEAIAEVNLAAEQPVTELKSDVPSSTFEEAVREAKKPVTELKNDVPSSSEEAVPDVDLVIKQPVLELKSGVLSSSSEEAAMEVELAAKQQMTELKDDVLSSSSEEAVPEVKLKVEMPATELKRDVPSPTLDGGVTKFDIETDIEAPIMSTELTPVSLGADIPETTTTTVEAFSLQTEDIPVPDIEMEIPSVKLITEVPESAWKTETSELTETPSPVMASTPGKTDFQTPPSPQAEGNNHLSGTTITSLKKHASNGFHSTETTDNEKEKQWDESKGLESKAREINEKLGLNEDGTVSTKESDEDVFKFTGQGTPRSPVATKRCNRKKKLRSGGRKSSADLVENQPVSDTAAPPCVLDEPTKLDPRTSVTEVWTGKDQSDPSSEVTATTQPPSAISATTEHEPSHAGTAMPVEDKLAERMVVDAYPSVQSETPESPSKPQSFSGDTAIAQPKTTAIPESPIADSSAAANPEVPDIPAQPESSIAETRAAAEPQPPPSPAQPELMTTDSKTAVKPEVPTSPAQPESPTADSRTAVESEVPASSAQAEAMTADSRTAAKQEIPASPAQPEPSTTDTRTEAVPEAPASSVKPTLSSSPAKPEVSTGPAKPQPKPAETRPAAKPDTSTSPVRSQPTPVDQKSVPKPEPRTSYVRGQSAQVSARPAPTVSRPILPDRTLFLPGDEGRTYASLLQQGADMLPARPVFTAHACHVCKRLHTKQHRLKSCGSCRLVAYCSAEHQRAHWPLHRAVCKVITRRVRHLGTDHLYREALNVASAEQWKKIRFKHMAVCEEMLGRPMEAYEKEMFLYPRTCDTCHETNPEKLHTCAHCHSVSFCSEDHLRKNHSKYCKDLRLLLDIHSYQNSLGVCEPALPETALETYEPLPPHIRELLVVGLLGPQRAMALGPVPLAVLSDYASYPLTLLYALQNIPTQPEAHISQLSELVVHVVGAEHATDCHPLSRWDAFLLHLLPRLRRLHVVFVGLELEAAGGRPGVTQRDFTCAACRAAGRELICELQPSTAYHTYCRSPQFRPPHVIAAFNAGLHRFAGHERRDTWRETMPYLVREGVPLVLTGYTLLDCPQDVARVQQEQRVDVLLPPMKNPYRSTRPQQNFLNEHEAPVVFKNQYVACLTAAGKARK